MKLVTVTCKRDARAMLVQAESIGLFLDPVEHIVIIEDDDYDEPYWRSMLEPHYKNHTFSLRSYNNYGIKCKDGWLRQQCYKLLAAHECDSKYMVLDSKNFFIKKTSLLEFKNFQASNVITSVVFDPSVFPNAYMSLFYANYFNKDALLEHFKTNTPYVIDTAYINKKELTEQVMWFSLNSDKQTTKAIGPLKSEFLFYNYMAYDLLDKYVKHPLYAAKIWLTFAEEYGSVDKFIEICKTDPNCRLAGLHRLVEASNTAEDKIKVLKWMKSIGFTTSPWHEDFSVGLV